MLETDTSCATIVVSIGRRQHELRAFVVALPEGGYIAEVLGLDDFLGTTGRGATIDLAIKDLQYILEIRNAEERGSGQA